ncbi:Flp pilus assembly CpaF family ATPase, partial [Paenibacillus sp. DS2015]
MDEDEVFQSLRSHIRAGLDVISVVDNSDLMKEIERTVFGHKDLQDLTAVEKRTLVRRIFDSFRGLDVLQPLVDNPAITEIMINSHQE